MKNKNQLSYYGPLKWLAAFALVMLFMLTATLNTLAQENTSGDYEGSADGGVELTLHSYNVFDEQYTPAEEQVGLPSNGLLEEITFIPASRMASYYEVGSLLYYHSNDGRNYTGQQYVTRGDAIYLPGEYELGWPRQNGYRLEGWSVNKYISDRYYAVGHRWTGAGAGGQVQHLYAVWKQVPKTFKFTYHSNGGNEAPITTTMYEGYYYNLYDGRGFSRDGYKIVGWSTSSGDNNSITHDLSQRVLTDMSMENMTLYAVWQPDDYTFTYDPNEKYGGAGTPVSYTGVSTETVLLKDASEHGFSHQYGREFLGWDTNKDAVTPAYPKNSSETMSNLNGKTLYAIWSSDVKVTVKYENKIGGELAGSFVHTAQAGDSYSPSVLTIGGYTFEYWFTSDNPSDLKSGQPELLNIQSDITVTLVYDNQSKYTVKIYHRDLANKNLDGALIENYGTNPTVHETDADNWSVPLLNIMGYEAVYYTLSDSPVATKYPMSMSVDLSSLGGDYTIYVYYLSTVGSGRR